MFLGLRAEGHLTGQGQAGSAGGACNVFSESLTAEGWPEARIGISLLERWGGCESKDRGLALWLSLHLVLSPHEELPGFSLR